MAALSNTAAVWHWLFNDTYVAGAYNLVDISANGYTLGATAANTDSGTPLNDGAKVVGGHAMASAIGGAGMYVYYTYPPPAITAVGQAFSTLLDEWTLDIVFRPTAFTNCVILEALYPFNTIAPHTNYGVRVKLNGAGHINADWTYGSASLGVNPNFVGNMVLNGWNAVTIVKKRNAGWVANTNEIYDLFVYHQGNLIQTSVALHNSSSDYVIPWYYGGGLGVGGAFAFGDGSVLTGDIDELRLRAGADTAGNIAAYIATLGVLPPAPATPPQTYDRVWQFVNDSAYTPTNATDFSNHQLWAMCSMLTGGLGALTQGLWTVAGSSNGVTAGMDAVDRWHLAGPYTAGDFVHAAAGAAHSWMVLQSPLMNGHNFYMLVSCDSGSHSTNTFLVAKSPAFTGGSTTANPTSSDSWFLSSAAAVAINGIATNSQRHNICLSTTGDFFFWTVLVAAAGAIAGAIGVMAPVGCHSSDLYPLWQAFSTGVPGSLSFTQNLSSGSRLAFGLAGNVCVPYKTNPVTAYANANGLDLLSGSCVDMPMWLATYGGGVWHARGRVPDMFLRPSFNGTMTPGQTVRDAGGVIRYQTIGDIIVPANAASTYT